LDHRTDRLEHIKAEFEKMGIQGERVQGIQPKSPAVGCTMSHIKCLELAKSRDYDQVFICEDDITFTNPELFKQNLNKFVENENINWDVYWSVETTDHHVKNCTNMLRAYFTVKLQQDTL